MTGRRPLKTPGFVRALFSTEDNGIVMPPPVPPPRPYAPPPMQQQEQQQQQQQQEQPMDAGNHVHQE